eukprot:31334-Pelagococcus_subviridis.AAC.13
MDAPAAAAAAAADGSLRAHGVHDPALTRSHGPIASHASAPSAPFFRLTCRTDTSRQVRFATRNDAAEHSSGALPPRKTRSRHPSAVVSAATCNAATVAVTAAPPRAGGDIHIPVALAATSATDSGADDGALSIANAISTSSSSSPPPPPPPPPRPRGLSGAWSTGQGPCPGANVCVVAPVALTATATDDRFTIESDGAIETRKHGRGAAADAPFGAHGCDDTRASTGPDGVCISARVGSAPGSISTRAGFPNAEPSCAAAAM